MRARFPQYDYDDMVRSQHAMLVDGHLGEGEAAGSLDVAGLICRINQTLGADGQLL